MEYLKKKFHRLCSEKDRLIDTLKSLEQENKKLRHKLDSLSQRPLGGTADKDNTQALQLAELIIDNSPAILFRRLASEDPKLRKMVYVSPNISRFGYTADDFLTGKIMFRDLIFHEDSDRTLQEIRSYVENGEETYTQFYRIVTREGKVRWIEDRTSIVDDSATGERFHQGIVIDIHERKEAEEKLLKSEEKYRRIVETAGEGFLLMDKDMRVIDLNSTYTDMVGLSRTELIGQLASVMVEEGHQHLWSSISDAASQPEFREFECEIRSVNRMSIPVLVHANTLQSDNGETIGTMAFLTDMTEQKKALSLAAEVQRSLMPDRAPAIDGIEIAGKSIPCDEVGGDYFDYLEGTGDMDRGLTVVVGDITGHGIDSALLMSSARASLRMRASQPGTVIDRVTALNQHLTKDVYATGRFMTLFYLTINMEQNTIQWVRAGHDPGVIYTPDTDQFEELRGPGLALGVDQDYEYQVMSRNTIKAGQIIAIGTDGIWESCNQDGEMFGKERFNDSIRRNIVSGAEGILQGVFHDLENFSRGVKAEDDVTLVIIKIS